MATKQRAKPITTTGRPPGGYPLAGAVSTRPPGGYSVAGKLPAAKPLQPWISNPPEGYAGATQYVALRR